LGGHCFCARRYAEPPALPAPSLASLIEALSEPGGHFDSDNFVSNETAYLQVAEALDPLAGTGAYLGVGPEQNFNYIARLRPRWAFVVDIRRQNMLQHLLYAAILAKAETPYEYLRWLFSRPKVARPGRLADLTEIVAAVESLPPTEEVFESNLAGILGHITGSLRYPLTEEDRAAIRAVYRAFYEGQLDLRFTSHRRPSRLQHPSYRELLTSRSPSGRHGNFLASQDDYRFVRELSRAGRLVPVVGDFAGGKALREVGRFLKERGEAVSAFYLSNVEFYLIPAGTFPQFVANVRELPIRDDSVLVRACFHYGRYHPAALPGHRSTTILQRIPRFLELYDSGGLTSYWDVCAADYLP
jgi:hypothetical protein